MDMSKLKPSDWLIGGGTLAFLIFMFLDWFSRSEGGFTLSASGWDYFLGGILPLLLLLVATVLAVLPKLVDSVKVPERIGPVTRLQAALIAASLAALLVLLRLVIPAEIEFGGVDTGENYDRQIGLILAVIAALAAAAGAFMKYSGREPDTTAGPGTGSGPATPF